MRPGSCKDWRPTTAVAASASDDSRAALVRRGERDAAEAVEEDATADLRQGDSSLRRHCGPAGAMAIVGGASAGAKAPPLLQGQLLRAVSTERLQAENGLCSTCCGCDPTTTAGVSLMSDDATTMAVGLGRRASG
mmetsp:Transcript_92962/g.199372  ORF Transcript_92962/g.199372 Transcript_92962/m.199372 type:complete len:135 (+) Transcript_92962:424-828(+)